MSADTLEQQQQQEEEGSQGFMYFFLPRRNSRPASDGYGADQRCIMEPSFIGEIHLGTLAT